MIKVVKKKTQDKLKLKSIVKRIGNTFNDIDFLFLQKKLQRKIEVSVYFYNKRYKCIFNVLIVCLKKIDGNYNHTASRLTGRQRDDSETDYSQVYNCNN